MGHFPAEIFSNRMMILAAVAFIVIGVSVMAQESFPLNETIIADDRRSCERLWTPFQGSCYVFIGRPSTWYEAKRFCFAHRSSLASISSAAENAFVSRIALGREAFVGGTRTCTLCKTWIWVMALGLAFQAGIMGSQTMLGDSKMQLW